VQGFIRANATRRFDVQLALALQGARDVPGGQAGRPRLARRARLLHPLHTICGKMLDMRDLGDVLDHLHGQEIEEEPASH
jgi:hypothetical protein